MINYVGEHLLPGNIGNLLIVLSFTSSILATFSYFKATTNPTETIWKTIARAAFKVHAASVFSIMITLFYLISHHYFEYQYVWQHSSKELPMRYMLSCFWEGQEGSFLLWSFWHCVLGLILQYTARNWETSVMTVVSSVQIFLSSMLLGIFVFDVRIGSNPFLLLRLHPEFMNLPFVKIPTYLQNLDGRGLNPLLQNYWMTIHPPTLFLGFASTLIPFAFAVAGLWQKQFTEWLKPAIPWTFFGVMILGTGILMGGAWAYEALSFGGFWAWDPVENASLVPWLTFVAAAHVMLIAKARKHSIGAAAVLCIATFILILYSTFLTRSGILGDTSVHAFTDLGMSGQLLIYLLFFLGIALYLAFRNYKNFPKQKDEEQLSSREFWMFIGVLVLVISAFQIIATTSIPVFNKLFSTKIAPPTRIIEHYNSWQVPIAFLITMLIAVGQFFSYKKSDMHKVFKNMLPSFLIALLLSILCIVSFKMYKPFHALLLFGAVYATIANIDYYIRFGKLKLLKSGSSISHIGFALVMLGALISTSQSIVISQNTSGTDISKLGKDFSNNDNILLRFNDTLRMGDYFVTYASKRKEGVNHYFDIDYLSKNGNGKYTKEFTLSPIVQTNPRMGNAAEPDTRHYLAKDVYTHITYADMSQFDKQKDTYNEGKKHTVSTGDTIFAANSIVILEALFKDVDKAQYNLNDSDIAVGARLRIINISNKQYTADPIFVIRQNHVMPLAAEVKALDLKFEFTKLNTDNGKIDLMMYEKQKSDNFIILKAIVFPFINILWMGAFIMIIGITLSILNRVRNVKA